MRMVELQPSQIPRRNYFVRRRSKAGQTFLIFKQRILRIDEMSDTVWHASDGRNTVADIIGVITANFESLDASTAIGVVYKTLESLIRSNFVAIIEASPSESSVAIPEAVEEALLFDAFLAYSTNHQELWDLPRGADIPAKIVHRLVLILWETAIARGFDAADECTYQAYLVRLCATDSLGFVKEVRETRDLVSWEWLPAQNHIEIRFGRAVYGGNLDHRY